LLVPFVIDADVGYRAIFVHFVMPSVL